MRGLVALIGCYETQKGERGFFFIEAVSSNEAEERAKEHADRFEAISTRLEQVGSAIRNHDFTTEDDCEFYEEYNIDAYTHFKEVVVVRSMQTIFYEVY